MFKLYKVPLKQIFVQPSFRQMVQSLANKQTLANDQDFYTSKITDELLVMGTEDMEEFEEFYDKVKTEGE